MNKTAEEFKNKALESLRKYYDFGDSVGYSNTELSRISSCINKIDDIPAAPPPDSEGEMAGMVSIEGQAELHANEYYEKGSNSEREMAEHELWLNRKYNFMAGAKWALATLPTREQRGEKEKFAIRFSEWLMIQCEYKNHCVWEYRGEEYTQNELIEIFKRTTPLPSPPKH